MPISKNLPQNLVLLTLGLALFSAGLMLFAHSEQIITIESEESKNEKLESVFNQIKWIPGKDQDVWMMNQSHFGVDTPSEKWERLAIVIDKTTTPKTARFYQFKPGPLEWREELLAQRAPNRASCFTCHNNGPRSLRPISESTHAPLSWSEKVKMSLWNLRIKTYGRINYDDRHDLEDKDLIVKFRFPGNPHNDPLHVPVCVKCHNENSWWARGTLRRQQVSTIRHLVESGQMPPPGFQLTKQDQRKLQDFLRGFE